MRQLLLILFLFPALVFSQDTLRLHLTAHSEVGQEIINKAKIKKSYSDSLQVVADVQRVLQQLQGQGYLEASVDSFYRNGIDFYANYNIGEQYHWLKLQPDSSDAAILAQSGFKLKQFQENEFNISELQALQEKIITYFENNGYPFAVVYLSDVVIDKNNVSAKLKVDKNKLFLIDTIYINDEVNISSSFLYNYLDLHPGDLYNESRIRGVSKRIRDLPYLQEVRPFQVIFSETGVRINFNLRNRQSSRFNFLIGVLPNNELNNNKLLITGEANLSLVNPFGTGKSLLLEWRGLKPRSPELNARFTYPYFLGLPLGLDARLNIYKNDTFYVDVLKEFGVQYLISGTDYLKAFVRNTTTNVISVDTTQILLTRSLPPNLDIDNIYYGLEFHKENLDYRFNPRKGYRFTISGSAGTKKIERNNRIVNLEDPSDSTFEFSSLYDSLLLNSLNILLEYSLEYYWPLGNRSAVLTALQGGWLINEQIFENELFRIGGTSHLRGFDESAIRASAFSILTLEYRYLLSENSYFNIFWDGAYVKREDRNNFREFYPYGLGAGLAFETKAGVFGVSYALGRLDQENPIQFRNAKIHFGYVSYF